MLQASCPAPGLSKQEEIGRRGQSQGPGAIRKTKPSARRVPGPVLGSAHCVLGHAVCCRPPAGVVPAFLSLLPSNWGRASRGIRESQNKGMSLFGNRPPVLGVHAQGHLRRRRPAIRLSLVVNVEPPHSKADLHFVAGHAPEGHESCLLSR